MTGTKKSRLLIGVLAVILCVAVMLIACSKPADDATVPSAKAETVTYTVEIGTKSGMALERIGVYIYTDDTLEELVWFDKTDAKGTMTFTDVKSDSYVAVLANVPDGYPVDDYYPITGETTKIELGSELMEEVDLSEVTFELGGMMADFTFTAPDGTEYKISEILKEKKALILNFWYLECNPCRAEFPYLQEAYEAYSDKVEVLALNPVNSDDDAIAKFRKELELTFPMAKCDADWQSAMNLTAYPTTVVIDCFGNIAMIHKGSITEEGEFEKIFSFFSSDDYEQTIVESIEDLPEAEETDDGDEEGQSGGTEDDPLVYGGVTSFKITVKPEQLVYCQVYRVDGMYMSVNNKNAYVIYNDKTYKATYGSLGLVVNCPDMRTPCTLIFGNSGTETQTYTVNFGALQGTLNNPYTLELGEVTVKVAAGNDQGVYYKYKATADGILTVECTDSPAGVKFDYSLYNLSTYAMRNFQSDAETNAEGKKVVSVKVSSGQTVQFSAGTLPDSSGAYPAGTFTFKASFDDGVVEETQPEAEKILYAVTVTDADRKPLATNVQVYVTVAGEQTSLTTNENGVAYTYLEAGTYPVTVKVPDGYKARTTDFTLTPTNPTLSVKLDLDVVVMEDYTINVVDEAGQPIKGVLVSVGSSFGYTDEKGAISFNLPQASYTAAISVPAGYTSGATSFSFGSATTLTITLTEGTDEGTVVIPGDGDITYSVTVVDYNGKPQADVFVQFLKDGYTTESVSLITDADGVAKADLKKGNYTVSLSFSKKGYHYDASSAVLSADVTDLKILVTKVVTSKNKMEQLYVGDAYILAEGGTYVENMQANLPNYFLFTPTRSGTFTFSTSNPDAKISYWGGSTAFIQDMTASTDYSEATNSFTRNVKESNIGNTFIIGVTGASSCIVEIIRTGDAVLDETDFPITEYKGTAVPVAQSSVASGTKTAIDLSASTGTYNLVMGSDGYYHLNSVTGPVIYVDLGPDAPYISMYNMLGFTGFGGTSFAKTFRDANGNITKREDYTNLMMEYVECRHKSSGLYPLTEDLKYMLQNGGEYKGWWDSTNANYMFKDVTGFNPAIGWMFACCYFT